MRFEEKSVKKEIQNRLSAVSIEVTDLHDCTVQSLMHGPPTRMLDKKQTKRPKKENINSKFIACAHRHALHIPSSMIRKGFPVGRAKKCLKLRPFEGNDINEDIKHIKLLFDPSLTLFHEAQFRLWQMR